MKYLVTSDYHLGHGDIIKLAGRPFKSLDEMNTKIIKAHNSRVKEEDVIFHIGDFCFKGKNNSGMNITAKEWEKQLNGKIIFIKGNHDKNNTVKTIIESLIVKFGGYEIFMTHNPQNININYEINLVGHVHKNWKIKQIGKTTVYNVGIDVNDYMPLKLNEVIVKIEKFRRNYFEENHDISNLEPVECIF